mgnify:CR=1 FL=1
MALTPEQQAAVDTRDKTLLVSAAAGSGKTRVITCRIAYMLSCGILPEQILGLTFTNKAAAEMKERLAELCGASAAGKVTLGTFHAFAGRLLRKEIGVFGFLPSCCSSSWENSSLSSSSKGSSTRFGASPLLR